MNIPYFMIIIYFFFCVILKYHSTPKTIGVILVLVLPCMGPAVNFEITLTEITNSVIGMLIQGLLHFLILFPVL